MVDSARSAAQVGEGGEQRLTLVLPAPDSSAVESANSTFFPSAADARFVLLGVEPDVTNTTEIELR